MLPGGAIVNRVRFEPPEHVHLIAVKGGDGLTIDYELPSSATTQINDWVLWIQ